MKRILSILISIAIAVGFINPASALNETTELTVHYTRFEGDYKDWNLWVWPKGGEGKAYEFTEDDGFGKVARIKVPGTQNVDQLGIIVRLGEWQTKDGQQDRFVTKFVDGRAEIWLIQADPTIYYERPAITTKLATGMMKSFTTAEITLNRKTDAASLERGLSITTAGAATAISSLTPIPETATTANRFEVRLAKALTLGGEVLFSHPEYGSITPDLGGLFGSDEFREAFHYPGDDLGNSYAKTETKFRLWAPTATEAQLLIYGAASDPTPSKTVPMTKSEKGTWTASLSGDQNLTIYTYRVKLGGVWSEAVDPYVRAATINGEKGVVIDLSTTNPAGWADHSKPKFSGVATDAVFYELHVRDLAMDSSSGIVNKGKFLGLTETGTKTPTGKSKTGIDAVLDLGVTHLQLLPIYDYKTVDESRSDQFNWGYDPLNFNVPEGSYATSPADPANRISELKQTIQFLHSKGLRVVMDVVYNHVFDAGSHSFEKLVPGYFFRKNADGSFANGTGVGNEVASERSMASKYIVDSSVYWAREYQLDGFRFDLMGILDLQTMNAVRAGVDLIDKNFLIIGEGWNMGDILAADRKANQFNASAMQRIAHFNDGIRDGLKGSVFKAEENGWASGRSSSKLEVMAGIAGETEFGSNVRGSWGNAQPEQSVSYVEAHDNLTLFDKLKTSMPTSTDAERKRVFALASSVAILAQGIPFIHAGQEFMRSKDGDENSYKSPDRVNSLKWLDRERNLDMVNYFRGLLEIRAANSAFRINKVQELKRVLKFSSTPNDVIAYSLDAKSQTNGVKRIFVIHNSSKKSKLVRLPSSGPWKVLAQGLVAKVGGIKTISGGKQVAISAQSTMVLSSTK
ncbi:type I pullulanase [Aquiluna sp. KACHI24]|uniref:type I pullulanase n=1 Tax=Aquiluna sp. KACHI24 TaxID=2968831 RepID=UPI0021FD53A1|nr:type I pullulanase [Aquiluna sp. KACHI24]BDQ00386.1 type I pullulanase [Aquiluna sp. KACHI24]